MNDTCKKCSTCANSLCCKMQKAGLLKMVAVIGIWTDEILAGLYNLENSLKVYPCPARKCLTERVNYAIEVVKKEGRVSFYSEVAVQMDMVIKSEIKAFCK